MSSTLLLTVAMSIGLPEEGPPHYSEPPAYAGVSSVKKFDQKCVGECAPAPVVQQPTVTYYYPTPTVVSAPVQPVSQGCYIDQRTGQQVCPYNAAPQATYQYQSENQRRGWFRR
jgi:hypothetical protein